MNSLVIHLASDADHCLTYFLLLEQYSPDWVLCKPLTCVWLTVLEAEKLKLKNQLWWRDSGCVVTRCKEPDKEREQRMRFTDLDSYTVNIVAFLLFRSMELSSTLPTMCVCMCVHVCAHARLCACMCVCVCIYLCACARMCARAHMSVCMYVCV